MKTSIPCLAFLGRVGDEWRQGSRAQGHWVQGLPGVPKHRPLLALPLSSYHCLPWASLRAPVAWESKSQLISKPKTAEFPHRRQRRSKFWDRGRKTLECFSSPSLALLPITKKVVICNARPPCKPPPVTNSWKSVCCISNLDITQGLA